MKSRPARIFGKEADVVVIAAQLAPVAAGFSGHLCDLWLLDSDVDAGGVGHVYRFVRRTPATEYDQPVSHPFVRQRSIIRSPNIISARDAIPNSDNKVIVFGLLRFVATS